MGSNFIQKFWRYFLCLPSFVFVILMRALRPLVIIRLGGSDISRIGYMCMVDWYLSALNTQDSKKKYFDILYGVASYDVVCNRQWLKMWKRAVCMPSWGVFFEIAFKVSSLIPGHDTHIVPLDHIWRVQGRKQRELVKSVLSSDKPHITFTSNEEEFGRQALQEIGIAEGRPFVCFHARDSAYLDTLIPGKSWNYHDYRDSDIINYIPAVKDLISRGYQLVRMGAAVKEKLAMNHSGLIDYAANGIRTDFLDIYLGAKCRFFICSDTGISTIPEVFRRPAVFTNWTQIRSVSSWVLNGLFIFKKFYGHRDGRYLTFSEIMSLNFGGQDTVNFFKEQEITLTENSSEEIKDVVFEMEDRLNGKWKTTTEDEKLQEQFWSILNLNYTKSPNLRIGTEFLRQNQELLN